ncbi:hypothetical protein GCM10023205_28440 [Yinghuangia aomiensis]|uniref:Uncharacterized protein n=1 Tax=Yinghuangia aomiensis TaxID=676205 RepID=A0ABP9H7B6_9ACTN
MPPLTRENRIGGNDRRAASPALHQAESVFIKSFTVESYNVEMIRGIPDADRLRPPGQPPSGSLGTRPPLTPPRGTPASPPASRPG